MNLQQPVTDTAAFHCQQAIEKLLKAFLLWKNCEFEKIHDLRALTVECGRLDASFLAWIDQVGPLTAFAVRYRYPGPCDPSVEDVESALKVVGAVREFVLGKFPRGLVGG